MKSLLTLIVALMFCLSVAPLTHAQDQAVSVSAVGEIDIRPDTFELSGMITESSEKLKDAVTAFSDTRRRALASIEAVGIENLTVEKSDLSLSLAGDMQNGNQFGIEPQGEPVPPGSLTISQRMTLKVTGLDKLEEKDVVNLVVQIMEVAKDAGLDLAMMDQQTMMMMQYGMDTTPPGSAIFSISDPAAARKKATRAAMEKAREDAAFLAELAGGKLGPVVAIGDGGASGQNANAWQMWYGMNTDDLSEFSSTTLQDITVTRALSVSFKLITE